MIKFSLLGETILEWIFKLLAFEGLSLSFRKVILSFTIANSLFYGCYLSALQLILPWLELVVVEYLLAVFLHYPPTVTIVAMDALEAQSLHHGNEVA